MFKWVYRRLNIQMLALGLFTAIFLNIHFLFGLAENFPLPHHLFEILSVILIHTALLSLMINLIAVPWIGRYFIATFFLLASLTAYFADSFSMIVSKEIVHNVLQAEFSDALGVLTPTLLVYFLLFGVLPSAHIFYRVEMPYSIKSYFRTLVASVFVYLFVILINIFTLSSFYSAFTSEHKELAKFANPTFPIYSAVTYLLSK